MMGDEADDMIDRYFGGDMDDWDEDEESEGACSKEVRCKHCRERGLYWVKSPRGWDLEDEDGNRHECPARVAGADEFEVCTGAE